MFCLNRNSESGFVCQQNLYGIATKAISIVHISVEISCVLVHLLHIVCVYQLQWKKTLNRYLHTYTFKLEFQMSNERENTTYNNKILVGLSKHTITHPIHTHTLIHWRKINLTFCIAALQHKTGENNTQSHYTRIELTKPKNYNSHTKIKFLFTCFEYTEKPIVKKKEREEKVWFQSDVSIVHVCHSYEQQRVEKSYATYSYRFIKNQSPIYCNY